MVRKPTQKVLKELLRYNKRTGQLHWRYRKRKWFINDRACNRWNTMYAGKLAFNTENGEGYLGGYVFNRRYNAHAIIWCMITGHWPDPEVDHRNRNRKDNRWRNLREATIIMARRNRSIAKNNATGYTGICKTKRDKFQVTISSRFVGVFKLLRDAVVARRNAEKRYWS